MVIHHDIDAWDRKLIGTLASSLAQAVRLRGADTVFGVAGGVDPVVLASIEEAGLRYVAADGAGSACVMAAVHGLLVGRPAMALVGEGADAADAVSGAVLATLERFPLLVVSGAGAGRGSRAVAPLDTVALMRPATKWSGWLGNGGLADDTVHAAIDLAGMPAQGAVHLAYDPAAPSDLPLEDGFRLAPPPHALFDAQRMLADAARPLLAVGLGAVDDAGRLRPIVEALGCPVVTTAHASGFLPTGHRLAAGTLGLDGSTGASPFHAQADLVVALGVDAGEVATGAWPGRPVVTLATGPAGDGFAATLRLRGPLADLLTAIAAGTEHSWRPMGATSLTPDSGPTGRITQGDEARRRVLATVSSHAPAGTTVSVEPGVAAAVLSAWPVNRTRQLLTPAISARRGVAVAAAVGAALARPGRPVACVTVFVVDDLTTDGVGGRHAVDGLAAAVAIPAATCGNVASIAGVLAGGWERPRIVDLRQAVPATPASMPTAHGDGTA